MSKGEGWKGRKLKGLDGERDGRACFMHTDSYGISSSDSQTETFLRLFCLPFLVHFLFLTFSRYVPLSNTHIHTPYQFPDFCSPPFGGILTAVFVTNHPSNSPTNHLLLLLAAADFTIILAERKNDLVHALV